MLKVKKGFERSKTQTTVIFYSLKDLSFLWKKHNRILQIVLFFLEFTYFFDKQIVDVLYSLLGYVPIEAHRGNTVASQQLGLFERLSFINTARREEIIALGQCVTMCLTNLFNFVSIVIFQFSILSHFSEKEEFKR